MRFARTCNHQTEVGVVSRQGSITSRPTRISQLAYGSRDLGQGQQATAHANTIGSISTQTQLKTASDPILERRLRGMLRRALDAAGHQGEAAAGGALFVRAPPAPQPPRHAEGQAIHLHSGSRTRQTLLAVSMAVRCWLRSAAPQGQAMKQGSPNLCMSPAPVICYYP